MISAKVINIFLLEDREQPFCKLCTVKEIKCNISHDENGDEGYT